MSSQKRTSLDLASYDTYAEWWSLPNHPHSSQSMALNQYIVHVNFHVMVDLILEDIIDHQLPVGFSYIL